VGVVPFVFETSSVRVIRDETGDPWFVAKDIAVALGYADTAKAVKAHCKSARPVGVGVSPTLDPQTNIIPERDIYRLVMRSKLPSAEKFEEWVVGTVLPSIRKTGGYVVAQPTMHQIPQTLSEALRLAADLADQKQIVEAQLSIAAPKADALDRFADTDGSLCIRDAAKVLQVREKDLIAMLIARRWVYRRQPSKKLLAYDVRRHQGVMEHKYSDGSREDGTAWQDAQARITRKGIAKLAEIIAREGMKAAA
jgi:prophage antirepressor-like protein